jgi:hypothetical protein
VEADAERSFEQRVLSRDSRKRGAKPSVPFLTGGDAEGGRWSVVEKGEVVGALVQASSEKPLSLHDGYRAL